jgi:spectinomycin phosphotransferase/16S rRNA (guanine(1405)-N(7))-methyltransferase
VLGRIGDTYAIALYPYVEGRRFGFGHVFGPHDRQSVITTLAALHASAEPTRRTARQETFDLPQRQLLVDALNERDTRWDSGPYGEPARELVKTHLPMIERLLARHDQAAAGARDHPDRMVLTHGEPHPGNLIETGEGWKLVDWDTALLAPPERDLWSLHPTADPAESSYTDLTGRQLERSMLTFYREAWALNDIAAYVSQFREPHTDDANQREAWTSLNETVEEVTP